LASDGERGKRGPVLKKTKKKQKKTQGRKGKQRKKRKEGPGQDHEITMGKKKDFRKGAETGKKERVKRRPRSKRNEGGERGEERHWRTKKANDAFYFEKRLDSTNLSLR